MSDTVSNNANPLSKFFRKPVLYTSLPTNGKWYKTPINFDNENELAVYPTTAGDEILLKTPDALLNGTAIATMIKSCVPSLGDPWEASTVDIDKLLVAARIATHGQKMDLTVTCPACNAQNDYDVDLSILIDSFKTTEELDIPIIVNDLVIYVKPLTYRIATKINLLRFNNERSLRALGDKNDNNEELYTELVAMTKNINSIFMASSIDKIVLSDKTEVTEYKFIKEFVENIDNATYTQIKKQIDEKIEKVQQVSEFDVECPACKHKFTAPLMFDQSNFFVFGS